MSIWNACNLTRILKIEEIVRVKQNPLSSWIICPLSNHGGLSASLPQIPLRCTGKVIIKARIGVKTRKTANLL